MGITNTFWQNGNVGILLCPSPNKKLWGVLVDADALPAIIDAGFWRVANFYPRGFRLYAYATTHGAHRATYLHRFLTNPEPGLVVDHINHRSTDNRRSNLRCVTERINQLNRPLSSCGKSGLRGVQQYRDRGKWLAKVDGKQLGVFTDPNAAASAVQEYLRNLKVAA
jgi:hypothetical protein